MTTGIRKQRQLKYIDTNGFGAAAGGRGYHFPVDFAVRKDGLIFVLSRSGQGSLSGTGISVTDIDHNWHGEFSGYGTADGEMQWGTAIAIDSTDRLFLADEKMQRITIFDSENNYVSHWGTAGSGPNEFDGPSGLAFDAENNLLVVDHKNHRIQRYTADGEYIDSFGSEGSATGQFNYPWGITTASDGTIYVADWRNDRIQRFEADGVFIDAHGESGDGDGQFNRPSSVAVDDDGFIYVADWQNQRVQVFDKDWNFQTIVLGEAGLSPWAADYINANNDERIAREAFNPYPKLDVDEPYEVSARTEPYFWVPVAVTTYGDNRLLVLETARHRFQIFETV